MNSDDGRLRAHVDAIPGTPAFVRDRHLDVLASNALARALTPGFGEGANLARFTFLESDDYADADCYHDASAQVAAMLRESLDRQGDDAPFRRIVGELSATSIPFSTAWAREQPPSRSGQATFPFTPVGELTLTYSERWLDDRREEALIVLTSDDPQMAAKLAQLVSMLGDG